MSKTSTKSGQKSEKTKKIRPALTAEGQENQCVSLAMELAMQQLIDGTASSQVITHFLKLGSSREKLEQQKLSNETSLLAAKKDAIKSAEKSSEMYIKALEAMRRYSGSAIEEETEEY